MKRRLAMLLVAALILVAIAAPRGPAGGAAAQDGTNVNRWVVGSAGGPSSAGDVTMNDTLGQLVIGPSEVEAVSLTAGYWYYGLGPTSVLLLSFEALPQGAAILVTWETAHEVDNLGFNLYRAESPVGPMAQLNETLILPQVPPGSPFGATYEWLDESALVPGQLYYYWLEDVNIYWQTRFHGPVYAEAFGGKAVHLPIVLR